MQSNLGISNLEIGAFRDVWRGPGSEAPVSDNNFFHFFCLTDIIPF